MATADLYAWRVRWNERGRNSVILRITDEVIRVVQLEREPEDSRYWCQRDVTLVPVEAYSGNGLAFPATFADDTVVDKRCSIRPSLRRSQRKARNFCTRGEAGEVVLLLFVGAIVQEKFSRPQ